MLLAKTQELAVEGDVHVLRKAVDEAVNLRERGAAFEDEVPAQLRQGKEGIQRLADPGALQNGGSQPTLLGGGIQQFQSLLWRE